MKKIGNCEGCRERHNLNDSINSTFHRHFKYRKLPVIIECQFIKARQVPQHKLFLCKKCQVDVMRAMKNGDNWE